MTTREQFGKYLLLKKISEDPLGETFRAGVMGASGMDQVALLRIFNGQGIDGQRLWEAARARTGVQEVLNNPNLGKGVDVGEIEGIPYAAYDYVSGTNLAVLIGQAAQSREILPTEHALLIVERVALGLAAAAESRIEGQRILHGFLVPQLVMISNEGETRLLGFEMSQALRGFASNPVFRQHFGRFLAPEALAGAPSDTADDVYSLGVLLFELLTGGSLPADSAHHEAAIDQAQLAADEQPIPDAIKELLKGSLLPRDQRLADVIAWHKTLSSWMFEASYNPTTFNLAFFMHNLFRTEIERETQEMEVEKTMPVPIQQVPESAAPPAAEPPAADETGGLSSATGPITMVAAEERKPSKTGLWVGLAAVVLAAIGAGTYFYMMRGQATPPPAQPTLQPPPPEPQGPSEEELEAQIRDLMQEETSTMLQEQQAQYEDRLKELQQQLEATKKLAEEQQQRELDRQQAETQRLEEIRRREEEAEAARLAEEQRKAEEEAAAALEKEEAALPEPSATTEVAAAAPPPPPAPPPKPAPPPPPPPPQVRRGDLVAMGPGVQPPVAVNIQPQFPEMARRVNRREATVVVRVLIDENGKAVDTEIVGKKVGLGFETEAIQAVKRGTFKPATKNNVPVKMWFTLTVKFQR